MFIAIIELAHCHYGKRTESKKNTLYDHSRSMGQLLDGKSDSSLSSIETVIDKKVSKGKDLSGKVEEGCSGYNSKYL